MPGVFEICVEAEFSAAHSLAGYDGNCRQVHGHNWTVEVSVRCRELNDIGISIDFRNVKQTIRDIIKNIDHSYLNEHPEFKDTNPSSENIARFLYRELGEKINSDAAKVSKVRVSETRSSGVYYWEE
jgi:6-pyruvoyltetrahydropterin/6-carboxytetrahydropterin synthase